MATLEELEAQARNAQKRLNNARKRADENLGKRLRELVTGKDKPNREAQVERAKTVLDLLEDEIKQCAAALDGQDAKDDEQKQSGEEDTRDEATDESSEQTEEGDSHDEGEDGQGYEGESQYH